MGRCLHMAVAQRPYRSPYVPHLLPELAVARAAFLEEGALLSPPRARFRLVPTRDGRRGGERRAEVQ